MQGSSGYGVERGAAMLLYQRFPAVLNRVFGVTSEGGAATDGGWLLAATTATGVLGAELDRLDRLVRSVVLRVGACACV